MKKSCLITLAAIFSLLFIASCGENDETNQQETEQTISKLTVEETKQKLEEDGIQTIQAMDEMDGLKFIDVLFELSNLSAPIKEQKSISIIQNRIIEMQKQSTNIMADDSTATNSLINEFKDYGGVYEWNNATDEWEIKQSSDSKITYRFRMPNGDMAEVSLYNLNTTLSSDPTLSKFVADMPTSLRAHISIEDNKVLTYAFEAQYYSDDMVKYQKETINLENYTIESIYDLTNKSKVITKLSLTHNDYIILANELSITNDKSYDYYVDNIESEEVNKEMSTEFLNSANVILQTGNTKLFASADFNAILEEDASFFTDDTLSREKVKILNDNFNGYILFADSKEIIATAEFYIITKTDRWSGDTHEQLDFRFLFNDGSAIDEDFFTEGFNNLTEDAVSFYERMNSKK